MTTQHRPALAFRRSARGFSLVELMVGVAIGLVVTLAIFSVLSVSESRKRTTTSVNDVDQAGASTAYLIDRAIRSAGSGFVSIASDAYGCALNVQRAGATIMPSPAALQAPFGALPTNFVLAPVLIDQGPATGSDVITVMSGTAGFGEAGSKVIGTVGSSVLLPNTVGFRSGDLVLFALAGNPCLVSQVGAGFAGSANQELQLGTAGVEYATAGTAGITLATLAGANARVAAFGNVSPIDGVAGNPPVNPPQFRMFGVDANQVLVGYDPLQLNGSVNPIPVAEGVLAIRAIYGIDTTGTNRTLNSWVQPTGAWSGGTLRNGTAASIANLRNIMAVRIAIVMRTSLIERAAVTGNTSLTLFSDLPVAVQQNIDLTDAGFSGANAANFRYRVIESTIPLRNNLL